MGNPTGFLEFGLDLPQKRDPKERINDFKEVYLEFGEEKTKKQAARCMDCGTPFCHSGCPLGNLIPDFNDAVYDENWDQAIEILTSTNNFPEFTGRICPAPCEASCVLGINKPPVAIELIEKSIVEKAFEMGLIVPVIPERRTGNKVAVIGSGPAGLACAAQLNKAGHEVTVFERASYIGGLLRLGIPDFKLEKWVVERRIKIMEEEGIIFKTNIDVGKNLQVSVLLDNFDAIVLCCGATIPRDLTVPGRELKGIHFAMDFLSQQNNRVSGDANVRINHCGIILEEEIFARNKHVVVLGGGDTGSDCVGTSNRQKAKSITQIELLPKPPDKRGPKEPWPLWPVIMRTSSSHEEGCERKWSVLTKEYLGDDSGNLKALKIVDIEWTDNADGKMHFKEIKGTEMEIPCDLALLAVGFLHGETDTLKAGLDFNVDDRGLVEAHNFQTRNEKVFVAGDMLRGQSLVVWAISEGREVAEAVDTYLAGESFLEKKDKSLLNQASTLA